MRSAARNITALAALQGLLITNNVTVISLGGLTGYMLAEHKALATLPSTMYITGGACSTFMLSQLMRRRGRRFGFTVGAVAGMTGAAICTTAVALQSFWLFCLGALVAGLYTAAGGYYRFAAADIVADNFRSRAISFVLAGGIIGGILGPESSKITKSLLEKTFMGSYAALMVFALIALAIIRMLDIPPPTAAEAKGQPRPLKEIARQPIFVVACLGAITSYAVMNLMMGATPLAMQMCGLPYPAATLVIESHIIGMFLPALFAGSLIRRFGVLRIMGVGVVLYVGCVVAALEGNAVINFWLSGTLLGAGWCFLYVGGTTLLTESYRPEEKAKAQGLNDMLIFVVMGLSSGVSGAILYNYGWNALNWSAVPFLIVTGVAVYWLARERRARQRVVAAPVTAQE